MSKTRFTKMHGCGNDYIYVDVSAYPIADPSRMAMEWSDRHRGIGSDGLVLIDRSPIAEADFTMRIFNADGSEAMMCGNASRCVGKYLYEKGLTQQTEIRLLTLSGVRRLMLHVADGRVRSVTVDMGRPVLDDASLFAGADDLPAGTFVSMGNPHYVVFTDDVDMVETMGPQLEHHRAFPMRCNIEYARLMPRDGKIRARVWERGSGITMACGTGACAVAVAADLALNLPQGEGNVHTIEMDGGELQVEWCADDGHIYLTGPAEFVFEGEI